MTLQGNFDNQVAERMLEYADPTSSWNRRLWSVSTITELDELLECSQAVAEGTLTNGTLRYLRSTVPQHIMNDPGFGSQQSRAAFKALLPKEELVANSHDWHLLKQATGAARSAYLGNWATALRAVPRTGSSSSTSQSTGISVERCASSVVSFLLDEGLSAGWLHRWLTYHRRHNQEAVMLSDLLHEADAKISAGKSRIRVLVTFAKPPRIPHPAPRGWLLSSEVPAWRAANGCGSGGQRAHGGLVLEVDAFEAHGAVQAAARRFARVRARFALGSRRRFENNDQAWVEGIEKPFPLILPARRVEVHSLEREDQLFNLSLADPDIDAALELLEPAHDGQATATIAGAWAAVESLLSGPGDRANVAAADRLARITTCSFARHELTTLAWEHARSSSDTLAASIGACSENRDRARLMEAHIVAGNTPSWVRPCDELAYMRMKKILAPVGQGLSDVEGYLRDSLRRLYRQRNLILHSGKTNAVAVEAALRTAVPVVAAGIDRIVAASVQQQMTAMELAARARLAMDQYSVGQRSSVIDLLG